MSTRSSGDAWTGLSLSGVCKSYPGRGVVLDHLMLEVERGECVALLGVNGSGKSTLLRIILGLVAADSGVVGFRDAARGFVATESVRRGALLEGRTSLYERLSLRENCAYFSSARGSRLDEVYFRSLCDLLRVEDVNRPVRKLSTGNKQRCSIIASLCHRPQLLILDEPTLGLDAEGTERLGETLRALAEQQGTTIVVASHDPAFMRSVAQRALRLADGQLEPQQAWPDKQGRWSVEVFSHESATPVCTVRSAEEVAFLFSQPGTALADADKVVLTRQVCP